MKHATQELLHGLLVAKPADPHKYVQASRKLPLARLCYLLQVLLDQEHLSKARKLAARRFGHSWLSIMNLCHTRSWFEVSTLRPDPSVKSIVLPNSSQLAGP